MTQPIAALTECLDWLHSIKQRVQSARPRAALVANSELIARYYELGARIVERETVAQWGGDFIDTFSKDLRQSFPDIGGFSPKNLRYCRAFFRFYCDPAIWQQTVTHKLNFYLTAVGSLLKRDDDQPTIGLLLCRDKNNIEVEFALRDMNKPMGVSEYTLTETLPDNLKGAMPTVEEIERDLQLMQAQGFHEGEL
jgi:hypothetical protein